MLSNPLSCCCVSPRGSTALPLPLTKISRCFCIVRLFSYQRFKYFHFWLNISAQDKTYNLDFFEQLSKSMSVTTDKNTDKNITGTVKWIYSDNRKMCIFAGIRASISLPVFQLELLIPQCQVSFQTPFLLGDIKTVITVSCDHLSENVPIQNHDHEF